MGELDQAQPAPSGHANFVEHARIIGIRQCRQEALHPNDFQPQIRPQPKGCVFIELVDQFA